MGRRTRTLVVSPDPGLVQQVRNALEDRGIDANSVPTAAAALDVVEGQSHRLVVAASELPDRGGYDLAADLKALPDPPIVLLVGEDRDGKAITRSHAAGADGFLHRPLRIAELMGRIGDLMGADWLAGPDDDDSGKLAGLTGVSPHSLVDPKTGLFVAEEENTGYSLSVIDDDSLNGGDIQPSSGNTEELPALAIEEFDEANPVSVPVSADVTAHGMTPVRPPPSVSDNGALLGPDTGGHPPVRPNAVATNASIDARIAELMEPGGALSKQIEDTVASAVSKALAEALPAVLASLDKGDG